MRVRPRAQSRRYSRQINGMTAKRRSGQREQTRSGKQRAGCRTIAVDIKHRHAGNILRGHGDDKKRQGNANDCRN